MKNPKIIRAVKRAKRVKAKLFGTADRPRLVVRKSHYALLAQLVDDEHGTTIATTRMSGKNVAAGKALGETIAKMAATKKVTTVIFDRGAYQYHGVIAAVADAARAGGLAF